MENQIVKIDGSEFGLSEDKAKSISQAFKPMLDKMVELENEFNEIVSLETSIEKSAKAGELRKKYVKTRTGSKAIHTELKAFYLQGGRFVDAWLNTQKAASTGKENSLVSIEKHFENIEKEKLLKIHNDRANQLIEFDIEVIPENLHQMKTDVWEKFLFGTKSNFDNIKNAEIQVEKEAAEKVKAYKYRQEKIEAENKKLKIEAEKIRIEQEKVEAENQRLIKKAEAEAEKVKEKEEAEKAKGEAEKQKIIDEANAKQEKIETENKRLKDEADAKQAKLEAEKQASLDRIEKEKQEKIAAENKIIETERLKGDADKFKDLAIDLELLKTKYSFSEVESFNKMSKVSVSLDNIIKLVCE